MLRYMTAGESHGRGLVVIVDGLPAGLPLTEEDVNQELARRQRGYGRGARMAIERDRVQIIGGVRHGRTLGSPVGMLIENRDWENWREVMSTEPGEAPRVTRPRPGHADLAGLVKYGHDDVRNVLERASARETAARVAAGAVAAVLLREVGIRLLGYVVAVGEVTAEVSLPREGQDPVTAWESWRELEKRTMLRCPDPAAEREMIAAIDRARSRGDTLGGVVEVVALGVPPGLGSYGQWDRRLDGRLAGAVMAVNGIKAVEIGDGFRAAARPGSLVHDPILPGEGTRRWRRASNRAGGLEGGVTNGEPVVLRAAMKPIATLARPLPSVDIDTWRPAAAHHERSDVCAVPAAGVVVEAAVSFVLADAFLEKFGGDSMEEVTRNYAAYREGFQ